MFKIEIVKEFSSTPGPRYKREGKYSGEEFRERLLIPRYLEAKEKGARLMINLDGGYGYPTSFLEEAFGGLARKYPAKEILEILDFVSLDEPSLVQEIRKYVESEEREE